MWVCARFSRIRIRTVRLALLCTFAAGALHSQVPAKEQLQNAYKQMHDFDFAGARQTLAQYTHLHSEDPMGPLADAAANLFDQFHRLKILSTDFLSRGGKMFGNKPQTPPDPHVEQAFYLGVQRTQQLAAAALRKSSNDTTALLANVLAITLRGDYDALVKDHGWQALKEIEEATGKSHHLLSVCSSCYDADLAVGVENYILGRQSGVTRLFLRLNGAETDQQKGLQELGTVAAKGEYFRTYAKVLLALAAIRAHNKNEAKELMSELMKEYPNNTFFREALKAVT